VTVRGSVLALVLLIGLHTQSAHAQRSAADKAAAEGLFDQGLALMREARFREACVRLEQSQALDRGIGTMLYLADCYDQLGRTASAWALFREAASEARAAGQAERAQSANQRAGELEPKLAKLSVETSPGGALPGLVFSIDGTAQPLGMWGVALPIDPGEHKIEARAPGYSPWSTAAQVAPVQALTVTIPRLTRDSSPAQAPTPLEAAAASPGGSGARNEPSHTRADALPVERSALTKGLAFGIGGAGVAIAAAGIGFGVLAINKNNDAKDYCPGGGARCNEQRGVTLTEDAQTAAKLANGLIIGGAVLAAAGVVLYFYHPWDKAPQLALKTSDRGGQLVLGGVF
jgi:tetratricopeptide (TPR) repeat protein